MKNNNQGHPPSTPSMTALKGHDPPPGVSFHCEFQWVRPSITWDRLDKSPASMNRASTKKNRPDDNGQVLIGFATRYIPPKSHVVMLPRVIVHIQSQASNMVESLIRMFVFIFILPS